MLSNIIKFSFIIVLIWLFACTLPKATEDKNNLKVQLGKNLFFDKTLSFSGNVSCSSCHVPEFAFSDGYKVSVNGNGEQLALNSPSLLNLQNYKSFSQIDSNVLNLFSQMDRPLFGKTPVELGLDLDSVAILKKLSVKYSSIISKIYHKDKNISTYELKDCIVQFINSLTNRNSKWDSIIRADFKQSVAYEDIIKGNHIFKRNQCHTCHGGIDYNVPAIDTSFFQISTNGQKYRIAGLRNLEYTKPYLHDGSAINLKEVIEYHNNNKWMSETNKIDCMENFNSLKKFLFSLSGNISK